MTWRTVKLGDVCSINNGGTPKSKVREYWDGGVQWLTPKDMGKLSSRYVSMTGRQISQEGLDNSSAKIIPEESVVLSCRAPIGHVAINQVPMSFNQGCKGLVPTDKILVEYLYYFLISSKQLLNDLGTGTTFKEISAKTLHQVDVPLPPIAEQQRIVAKLDASFAEIDEVVEKALAKEKEIEKFKNSFLTSMLNNNNWEEIKLNQICTKITDGSHNPPKGVPLSDFLMLSSKNIFNDAINFEKPRFLKEEDFIKENKRTDIQEGDILLTIVGTIGRCAVVNDYSKLFTLQRSVAVLKPIHDLILSRFLMYTLQNMLQILHQGARGVAQKGVYLKSLKELTLRVPPLSEQHNIISKLDAMNEQIDSFRNFILSNKENYKALKSAILKSEIQQNKAA